MAPEADKPGLGAGLRAAGRGVRRVLETPEIGKTYLQLVAVLFVLAGVLSAGGIWVVLRFTPIDGTESWWLLAGMWVARVAGMLLVALVCPILALFTANILFPVLGERVFLAGVRAVSPKRADELAALEGLPLWVSVPQNLIRMALFIGLSIFAFAVSMIPVAGVVLGPALQVYFTSRALGWELLDPYFEKLDVRFDAQHAFVKEHRGPLVGFALPFSLAMSIPLVGPLLFGVAQAAAGTLVVEVFEATPTPSTR
ncbi:MAG: EI24 domain-containing protein [Nannocystaceae bacterium]|nr:EI24 domain-containing protein [Nannocystaceae bacterium]